MEPDNKEIDFYAVDKITDDVSQVFDILYDKEVFSDIENKIKQVLAGLPDKYSINFLLKLDVFDSEKERAVNVYETGLTCGGNATPYRVEGGEAFSRFLVDGKIVVIPHAYCPNCWTAWMFKLEYCQCHECEYELGNQIKYLIDENICPYCEEGEITRKNNTCDKCNRTIDEKYISWG